jgi:hypothetical protein
MAFNFLARMMGPDFALRRDFDPIRVFVRDGAIQPYRMVTENQTPILADDEFLRRQTSGHLIVIQWDGGTDDLASLFSLFNEITYRVVLCRGFSGVWRRFPTDTAMTSKSSLRSRCSAAQCALPDRRP